MGGSISKIGIMAEEKNCNARVRYRQSGWNSNNPDGIHRDSPKKRKDDVGRTDSLTSLMRGRRTGRANLLSGGGPGAGIAGIQCGRTNGITESHAQQIMQDYSVKKANSLQADTIILQRDILGGVYKARDERAWNNIRRITRAAEPGAMGRIAYIERVKAAAINGSYYDVRV